MWLSSTADTAVPYNGTNTLPSVPVDLQAWADRAGCSGPSEKRWQRGVAASVGWRDCRNDTQVELVTITGGVHEWIINSDFQSSLYALNSHPLPSSSHTHHHRRLSAS